MTTRPPKSETEAYPDSWARFERAVDAGVKSGPKHKKANKKANKKAKSQKRVSLREKP